MRRAFITGITGQDGAYLSQFLLGEGYQVFGLVRGPVFRDGFDARLRRLGVVDELELVDGDIDDFPGLRRHLKSIRPHEVYNLAAHSAVATSWDLPLLAGAVTGLGAANVLEAYRLECPEARFYQASSSEMFGLAQGPTQNEKTPFHPRSPYGAAKVYAHWMAINYRESFRLPVCCGILFNHESPLRGIEFVSRKITNGVARIKLGLQDKVTLGNLDAKRDRGHARDFVKAMWLMMQQEEPEDYVIATGRATSVLDFCHMAFAHVGLRAEDHIGVDEKLLRPAEVDCLVGDASKARRKLLWSPETTLEQTVAEMVEADLAGVSREIEVNLIR